MGNLSVFEADANAVKLTAEAAANDGFELEKSVDRAIFRAKQRFGAYLANAQSKSDWDERWAGVSNQVIKVIAEVVTPTPKIIRRVGAALRPSLPVATKKVRPSSTAKTAATEKERREYHDAHRDELIIPGSGQAIEPKDFTRVGASEPRRTDGPDILTILRPEELALRVGSAQKLAWTYDQGTKLWTSKDPMTKFACPGCGTEQEHLGFSHCAGCERTWNSWPVRQQSSAKTGASTYVVMAREVKMRGDQFKMAAAGNVKVIEKFDVESVSLVKDAAGETVAEAVIKVADGPQEPPPGMSQPSFGTMPGDNSGAMGAPAAPEPPTTPASGTIDNDIAGQVTEDSPIDQIQDALQDAIVALKDVQMLSINPALSSMASSKVQKVATLRSAMDRFWKLHRELNYVAGMLAKEANEAVKTMDPRITSEAEFVQGYTAASQNLPLPPTEKTGRDYLEGYVAFHKQAESYSDGANIGGLFVPTGQDETAGTNDGSAYQDGAGRVDANEIRSDAGPFDTSQPASRDFASNMDADNAAGVSRGDEGESSSIQPRTSGRAVPKGRR